MEPNRNRVIIKTSIIGIIANVFLAAFKAFVGLLSHSIAVVMDAVNNLSDALSSLITIIGTRLSQKAPDKKHPLGHGRIEYLSATIIAAIVLYAGITALIESVKSILDPGTPDYTPVSLIIIGAAVIVKILLGNYVKHKGRQVDSDALIASGSDALFDAILSASTFAAAIIYLLTKVSLEAYLGVVISIFIIKAGFEMLRDTISEILGERVDADLALAVKSTIIGFPEVKGAYDLVIHNYGPEKLLGSVHIALPDAMPVEEVDTLERAIAEKVYEKHGVALTGISVYGQSADEASRQMEAEIRDIMKDYPEVLQLHGFYLRGKDVKFDIIISFDTKDREAVYAAIVRKVKETYPAYNFSVLLDADISD